MKITTPDFWGQQVKAQGHGIDMYILYLNIYNSNGTVNDNVQNRRALRKAHTIFKEIN